MILIRARVLLFSLTLVAHVMVFAMAWSVEIGLDLGEFWRFYAVLISSFGLAVAYAALRGMEPMRVALECVGCGLLLAAPVALSTYLAMGARAPLADAALTRMDEALGFDWIAFIRWVDAFPLLSAVLGHAYHSFVPQLILVPVLLVAFGRRERAYAMVLGYGVLCLLSSLIAIWHPALGAYEYYGITQDSLANINAYVGFDFLGQFHAVRGDPDFVFSVREVKGIITFPSVHVAVAVLCAWAMWAVGALRLPCLALNALMAVSALTHGGHYLVDVIAGLGVAAVTIAAVAAACGLRPEASAFRRRRSALPI